MKIGNYLKSQRVHKRRFSGGYSAQVEQAISAPGSDHDLRRRLVECFKQLVRVNRRFARVLNLSHQGYLADEICGRMRITLSNLYSIMSRGRSLLKQCLESGRL
jgi:DNA-directed RNA polymerase specialized sigma24 family protein